jgi:hypothetical protein
MRALDTSATWSTKDRDVAARELEFKTWLLEIEEGKDALSIMDNIVFDKQIGKLGDRTETNLYDSSQKLPIFEMRDISGVMMKSVPDKLKQLEEKVKAYHEAAEGSASMERRQALPPKLCKLPKQDCKGNQAPNPKGECEDCGKGKKPNEGNKACVWEESGCPADQMSTADNKCEKCPTDQVPDATGKKCEPKDSKPEKEQGKCPEGQILDPAQGGQDKNTEKPVCISDDDKKCPPGQIAETRRKGRKVDDEASYEPTCSKPEPGDENFRCPEANTYHHIETPIGDDKQRHSCRATRKAEEEKKNKYQKFAEAAGEGKKKDDADKDKKRQADKRRARTGSCWVLFAEAGAFLVEELQAMSQDEIDGMMDMWPDENIVDPLNLGDIPDHVVEIRVRPGPVHISMDTAGFPNLGKIFSGAGKAGGAGGKGSTKIAKEYKTGSKGAASAKALQAAKNSKMVDKILKDKRFLDCLGTTAAAAALDGIEERTQVNLDFYTSDYLVNIDWSRKPNKLNPTPEDRGDQRIAMHIGTLEDWSKEKNYWSGIETWMYTYPDTYIREDRLLYETCQTAAHEYDNAIKSAEVQGGCCQFYDGSHCEPDTALFAMENRGHGELQGSDKDAINSWWCTFKPGCKGAPGL